MPRVGLGDEVMTEKAARRFRAKVNKGGPLPAHCPELGPCWIWVASCLPNGYGQFWLNGKRHLSHRLMWSLTNGPIPDGLCVLHNCDNPGCVRVSHLFLGTQGDNLKDMGAKGRHRLQRRPGLYRGARHPQARLTEIQAIGAMAQWLTGRACAAIAAEYGVSSDAIGDICRGKTWKHLFEETTSG